MTDAHVADDHATSLTPAEREGLIPTHITLRSELNELAVRFHHRLVSVHPFPNGNGRWSRLAADVLIIQLGGARFTWGGADLQATGDARKRYIEALQPADKHDLEPLIRFARS